MQTYTHFVITEFLNRKIRARQAVQTEYADRLPPLVRRATLIGSVIPDAPLTLTFLIFLAMDQIVAKDDVVRHEHADHNGGAHVHSRVAYLFGTLFFKDWRMKLVHNLFHAPILTSLYTAVGYFAWRRGHSWGAGLFWFGLSCTLHTAIDIPLHYDDGPLIYFPFDWQKRYYSPVSYWDSKRYGRQFSLVEHLLLVGLVGYIFWENVLRIWKLGIRIANR